jgi:hypothetical protein
MIGLIQFDSAPPIKKAVCMGRIVSQETRQKISAAQIGISVPARGKPNKAIVENCYA